MASQLVPFLMIAGWFGIAAATMVNLAGLGGTLAAVDSAEQARQASLHAPRVASIASNPAAE